MCNPNVYFTLFHLFHSKIHTTIWPIQCIVNGDKNPNIAPSPWDCVTPPEKDRATAIGNMHNKCGKDHTCDSGDMLMDRQTHRHTNMPTTILCHDSRGQSKNCWWSMSLFQILDRLSCLAVLSHYFRVFIKSVKFWNFFPSGKLYKKPQNTVALTQQEFTIFVDHRWHMSEIRGLTIKN